MTHQVLTKELPRYLGPPGLQTPPSADTDVCGPLFSPPAGRRGKGISEEPYFSLPELQRETESKPHRRLI